MANSQAKAIDFKTAEFLFREIQGMEANLKVLRLKVLEFLPAKYGTDLWWEKSDAKALREIANGKGIKFKNAAEVIEYLES